jgi:hypothetical protein
MKRIPVKLLYNMLCQIYFSRKYLVEERRSGQYNIRYILGALIAFPRFKCQANAIQ